MLIVFPINAIIAEVEKRTGRTVVDSSFENDTMSVVLSGGVTEITIDATFSNEPEVK